MDASQGFRSVRVLVIAQYFPPDRGGGSRRVTNAIAGLRRRGHQVEVVTAFPHYPHGNVPKKYRRRILALEKLDGVRVNRVWIPSIPHEGFIRRIVLYTAFAFSALVALPVVRQPDVIWAANPNVFSSLPAILYGVIRRAPIIRNVDDLWPEGAIELGILREGVAASLGRLLAKAAYKLCSAITPISRTIGDEISRHYRIDAEKMRVVEPGVDTEIFRPLPAEAKTKERKKSFSILYSGTISAGYDLAYLLDVAAALSEERDIRFLIRGFGDRIRELRQEIRTRNLPNVVLSTAFLPVSELVRILNSADILILPMVPLKTAEAGLPTKLLEYMACGKPIICSSKGEPADMVQRVGCGFVVSRKQPKEACRAILKLRSKPGLGEKMGENGRTYVVRHLSIDKIGEKLEVVFLSRLRNKAQPTRSDRKPYS